MYRIKEFFTRLKMGLLFFKRGFNSNSWDSAEIYLDIAQRLEICYATFVADENYLWCDSEDNGQMRKIRECIELCKRMNCDRYNENTIKLMEKYSTSHSKRRNLGLDLFPDAKVIDQKMYSYFFKKACEKDARLYADIKDRLFKLLSEGTEHWNT